MMMTDGWEVIPTELNEEEKQRRQLLHQVKHKVRAMLYKMAGKPTSGVLPTITADMIHSKNASDMRDQILHSLWPSWYGVSQVGTEMLVKFLSGRGEGFRRMFPVVDRDGATKLNLLIEGDAVTTTTFEFNPGVIDQISHEAPGRLIDEVKRTSRTGLYHHGQGLALPMNFMYDPLKMEMFRTYMKTMNRSVNETCLYTLMDRINQAAAKAHFERYHLPLEPNELEDVILQINDGFNMLSKTGANIHQMESEAYTEMVDRIDEGPDCMLAPRGSSHLLGAIHEDRRKFMADGDKINQLTVTTADEKKRAYPILRTPNHKWDIHMSKNFRVDGRLGSVDPLVHTAWVSQFFTTETTTAERGDKYKTYQRDIKILDGNRGNDALIRFQHIMKNCGLFKEGVHSMEFNHDAEDVLKELCGTDDEAEWNLLTLARRAGMEQDMKEAWMYRDLGGEHKDKKRRSVLPGSIASTIMRMDSDGESDVFMETNVFFVVEGTSHRDGLPGGLGWGDIKDIEGNDKLINRCVSLQALMCGKNVAQNNPLPIRLRKYIGSLERGQLYFTDINLGRVDDFGSSPTKNIWYTLLSRLNYKESVDPGLGAKFKGNAFLRRLQLAISDFEEKKHTLTDGDLEQLISGLRISDHLPHFATSFSELRKRSLNVSSVDKSVEFLRAMEGRSLKEWSSFQYLMDNDIPVPLDFIICRPWLRFQSSSSIFMKSGPETAVNILSDASLSYTNAAQKFTVYVHIRFDLGSTVRRPQNLHFFPDTLAKYESGGGVEFFVPKGDNKHIYDIHDTSKHMFAFAILPSKPRPKHWVCMTNEIMDDLGEIDDNNGGYHTREAYAKIWSWRKPNYHMLSLEYYFMAERPDVTICSRSAQYVYNQATGAIDKPVAGKCALGDFPSADTFEVMRGARRYNGTGIRGAMNRPVHHLYPRS